MTLPQAEIVTGLVAEMRSIRDLVAGLTEEEWAAPTRCAGWTVADLAAHLTGAMADITSGRLDGIDTQPWYDRQVEERRGRSPDQVAEELGQVVQATEELMAVLDEAAWNAPAPEGVPGTLGAGVESLWCGAYVHTEDILAALGRSPQKGPGIRAALSHIVTVLTRRGWGPATLALDDWEEMTIGGGGPRISGDALAFVLVATGRGDPASIGLDPGVDIYR